MRRAAGLAAAGGLAAVAGCLGDDGSWDTDREGGLQPWLYDPARYRDDVTDYVVGYWEPARFAAERDALGGTGDRLRRFLDVDPASVDQTVEIGGASAGGGLPHVRVSTGSFDADAARAALAGDFERVGSADGSPLYGDGTGGFAVADDGEFVAVRGLTRAEASSFVAGPRTFAAGSDHLADFFDVVGVGANAGLRLGTDDAGTTVLHGYAYRIDGETTFARALRLPGVGAERGGELRSYLDQLEQQVDRLRSASVEYDDERVLLDLEFATGRAPFGVDPLSNVGLGD